MSKIFDKCCCTGSGGINPGGGITPPACNWVDIGTECFVGQGNTGVCPCDQPADALQARALNHVKGYADWATALSTPAVIFEWGVTFMNHDKSAYLPQSDIDRYNDLQRIVFKYAACRGIPVAPWATGHAWGSTAAGGQQGYQLAPYEYDSKFTNDVTQIIDNPIAGPVTDYFQNIASRSYINYAGQEFWCLDPAQSYQCFHRPDQAPSVQMLQWLQDRGVDALRYPLGEAEQTPQDHLFNCASQQIDQAYIGHVENLLNNAQAIGMDVVLDVLHPWDGKFYNQICGENIKTVTGTQLYQAYATSLFNHTFNDNNGNPTKVMDHPALEGVDIVNEPHSNHGDNPQWNMSAAEVETWTNTMVTWYRNTLGLDCSKTIFLPLAAYSSAWGAPDNHPTTTPWWNDPCGNSVLSGHYYPDGNNAGAYDEPYDTYDENLIKVQNDGVQTSDFTNPDCTSCCTTPSTTGCAQYTLQEQRRQDGTECGSQRHLFNGSVANVSQLTPCTCPN